MNFSEKYGSNNDMVYTSSNVAYSVSPELTQQNSCTNKSTDYLSKASTSFSKGAESFGNLSYNMGSFTSGLFSTAYSGLVGCAAFDYLSGKVVSAKAASFFTASVAPAIYTTAVNVGFTILTQYPTTCFLGAIGLAVFASDFDSVKKVVGNVPEAAYNAFNGLYEVTKGCAETVAGVASLAYETFESTGLLGNDESLELV